MVPELRTSKILLALILLGVAWPGPRLVVHSHEQLACAPETISEHLRTFHQDCACDDSGPHGYHFHWVFSCDAAEERAVFPGECQQISWCSSGRMAEVQDFLLNGSAHAVHFSLGLPANCSQASHAWLPQTASQSCPTQPRLCVWNC